ncbi:MAG: TlyA family RNA methyltransferase [Oscillospiraceae bacterium]|jgi:23S rRNA (cytidine1920-2'-O)/16S rRNA (cytidine1409-2'-O)-methyltransferase|nr:TlyA family RNA methyltransferase [Oscillospiraceae bacterium]
MARKVPAWQRLVAEGLVQDRAEAERWILAGKVTAGGAPVRSGGQQLPVEAPLAVRGLGQRYVAKGGLKLEGALAAFGLSPKGRICLDAGASTGGFTDCLVQQGAALVYAVDVGYGQLAGSLRSHPRVRNLERTNLGDEALLALDPAPDFATADLSYLSLVKAVPLFARALCGAGDLVCLVKPLFEIDDAQARRSGEIDPAAYAPLLAGLCAHFAAEGHAVRGLTHSPVTGNHGTVEFFLWLAPGGTGGLAGDALEGAIAAAVQGALALERYQK